MSHASGAGQGAPASERVGEFEGRSPSMKMMTSYTALAIVAMTLVPRGAGEAGTGPDAAGALAVRG